MCVCVCVYLVLRSGMCVGVAYDGECVCVCVSACIVLPISKMLIWRMCGSGM